MRKLFLLVIGVGMALAVSAQGIEFFQGTYEEALQKAHAENKHIFVDVYTSWCGPCKMMAKNVFSQSEVGAYFNSHFVCLKLDAEKEKEHVFFRTYGVEAFPTFFWLDAQGNILDVQTGYKEPAKFLEIAAAADCSDLNKRLEQGKARWESGERTPELIREYVLEVCGKINPQQVKPMVLAYLQGLSDEPLKTEDNYRFLKMFMYEAGDNWVFRTLLKNADVYQRYGKDYAFWIDMYRMVVRCGIVYRKDPRKFQEYLDFLTSLNTPLVEMYRKILSVENALFGKDFDKGIPEAVALTGEYEQNHPYLAGQLMYTLIIAGFFMEDQVNVVLADQVVGLAKKALKTVPSKESLLYVAIAYAREGNYKKAYEFLASEPFFPEPVLSNALYKYLNLPVFHHNYLR